MIYLFTVLNSVLGTHQQETIRHRHRRHQAQKIQNEITMSSKIASILILIAIYSNAIGKQARKKAEIDSLFSIVSNSTNSKPDSALVTASVLEGILLTGENTLGLAELYNSVARAYQQKADYFEAIDYSHKSINLYRSIGDSLGVASNFITLGNTHKYLGHKKESLEYYLKSADIRKAYGTQSDYAAALYGLGNYFYELADYAKCGSYYLQALDIFEQARDSSRLADMYFNMGNLSIVNNELDKSLEYYEKSLLFYSRIGDEYMFPRIWSTIGRNFYNRGDTIKAKVYFLKAEKGFQKFEDKLNSCQNLALLCRVEMGFKRYKSALAYALKMSEMAEEIGAIRYSIDAYSLLASIYNHQEQFEQAYDSRNKERIFSDSLYNLEKDKAIRELTVKYETELKEQEIEKLSSEKELQEKEILLATTEKNAYMIAVVFAIALALAILAFFTQRQKAMQLRSEKALAERNTQINSLLQEQEVNTLSALLEGQEKERLRIAEELHDRLGSLLSAIKLNFNGWIGKRDLSHDEVEDYSAKTSGLLDEAVTEVRRVSHNLSTGQVSRYGLVGSMEDLAATVNRSDSIKMKVLHFNLGERLPIELETGIYRIVQEMLANVLKHANAKEFTVQLSKTDNSVILTAEDDGKGFDYKEARKRGGIGLHNIDNRVKKFGGQFSVDSSPGKGTIFTFEFPLEA
ncbi:putative Histidine kinase [Imperialibacter sp. EC-SDR9]|nr:putative Histidine kinase [Imperialibacter sp. 89]CAD5265509.1 putative Histidine kinase [Imperialibacter sp. 75]VVT21578.1 putative Histidine kinase [Imperialibacter sp. EC-SDR9]